MLEIQSSGNFSVLQSLFDALTDTLNAEGTNYTVSLRYYKVASDVRSSSYMLINQTLGEAAKVAEIKNVQASAVWPAIENALMFRGDGNFGPSAAALTSDKFGILLDKFEKAVQTLVADAAEIQSFLLTDGHPDYPVYWDFAFLLKRDGCAVIILGSSSD